MILKSLRKIKGKIHQFKAKLELKKVANRPGTVGENTFLLDRWSKSLSEPTEFYLNCVQFFSKGFSPILKEHRGYFSTEERGFGEDAFHVLWWMLFKELRPQHFLEIGVYRGQTLSLASLLQKHFDIQGSVTGISPFLSAGDAVSTYRSDVDYLNDTLENFRNFNFPSPSLIKAYSTDKESVEKISSKLWDAIYIDGNHDYSVAKQDWNICSESIRIGGVVILDDSALLTAFRPPAFATGGHPGPSKLAQEIDTSRFKEILQVGHNRVFQRIQ